MAYRDVEVDGGEAGGPAGAAGRRVVVVVGIDGYRAWPPLRNAVSDATGSLRLFEQLGFERAVPPLLDEAATHDALRRLVTDDLAGLGDDDSLVLFFAGHGYTRTKKFEKVSVKTGYVIPVDGDRPEASRARWLRLDSWLSDIARLPPRHILVILDACHSGIALDALLKWRGIAPGEPDPLEVVRGRQSRRVITSALDDQRALDNGPVPGHSLFTGCLVEALTGGLVKGGKRVATGSDLWQYVRERVSAYPGSQQTPDFGALELDDRGELVLELAPPPPPPPPPAPPPVEPAPVPLEPPAPPVQSGEGEPALGLRRRRLRRLAIAAVVGAGAAAALVLGVRALLAEDVRAVRCGDGVTSPGERCDDGNPINGDGCDSNCTPSACGNGITAEDEACDDGNTRDGDGCSAWCEREDPQGARDPFVAMGGLRVLAHQVTYREYARYLVSVDHAVRRRGRPRFGWDEGRTSSDRPVESTTFEQAAAYCAWLGARLPTVEEWQRASGGSWGIDPTGQGRPGPLREWTSTVEDGLVRVCGATLAMTPEQRAEYIRVPRHKSTAASLGEARLEEPVERDRDPVSGPDIGFRCVR